MPLCAILDINIIGVLQDPVDKLHRIVFEGNYVTIKGYIGGKHILDTSTGRLNLGDIQVPENPVVRAIIGEYNSFERDKFISKIVPRKEELHTFPTLFELEGFYYAMKENNVRNLERAGKSRLDEKMRSAVRNSVHEEEYFLNSFGESIYQQLKKVLGEPTFS